jgi:flagellar hook-associated protein 1
VVSHVAGLGAGGNLNAPYLAPATLRQLASTMVAAQAQDSANASSQLGTEQAVQTTLVKQLSAQSGVKMDTEMSNMIRLQSAYAANAKVIATVQAMWADLIATVR